MPSARRPSARSRILDAADRMFTEQGIRSVGIEAVIAAADTAKTTLYAHFGSKDALVVAYLQRRAERQQERLAQGLATHGGGPVERILHLYDLLAVELAEPGYRGSPFTNACVELGDGHPAAAVAREHRQWLLAAFTGLAAESARPDPDAVAAQLLLLYEAAAQAGGDAARTAHAAAEGLLTAAQVTAATRPAPAVGLPVRGSPEAHRLAAFLNSAHLPDGDDQLADDRAGPWIAEWLADARRSAPAALREHRDGAARAQLLVVREGLRELASVNCGAEADPHPVAEAAALLERTPLLLDLATGAEPRLTPADGGEAAALVIAVVVGDYLAVRARGEWSRLKVCASPECRWAFVDGTRNRSRRWCDMAGCGNRAKNRAWRSRQTLVTS